MNRRRYLFAAIACTSLVLAVPGGASGVPDPTKPVDLVSTIAGDGSSSMLNAPRSMAEAPGGGYYVVDSLNHRVRKVAPDGGIATVAGTGVAAFNGDGLAALSTKLSEPRGVAVTADGGLLIADAGNDRIRQLAPDFGTVTTVAGSGAQGGPYAGVLSGILGTDTELDEASAVHGLADGSFLIADTGNSVVRKVDPLGNMTTIAGTGTAGYSGDGGAATAAQLNRPQDIDVTSDGSVLIVDTGNHAIRRVDPLGVITTFAGTGVAGYSGDKGPATAAQLDSPLGIEAKDSDDVVIADTGNNVTRKIKVGEIKTQSGNGVAGFAGDGGNATLAQLSGPSDVLVRGLETLVADTANNRIRLVAPYVAPLPYEAVALPDLPVLGGELELPAAVAPAVGQHLQVTPQSGAVRVKMPRTRRYLPLRRHASIPMGSVVDATRGSLTVTSARDSKGRVQRARFGAGAFKIGQRRTARPVTELVLHGGDFRPCWRRGTASASGPVTAAATWRGRVRRRLWGSGKGRFRTRGRHGAATVRGTSWRTEDSCLGTRVRVKHGLVAVRDVARHRTVLVPTGRSYLAKARR